MFVGKDDTILAALHVLKKVFGIIGIKTMDTTIELAPFLSNSLLMGFF